MHNNDQWFSQMTHWIFDIGVSISINITTITSSGSRESRREKNDDLKWKLKFISISFDTK
ncbi:hypothetical protein DERP_013912 [Dermatophagoides pteronyssinus]|uniref:Uncharacterized protein n=1 Tax=Dermatophagoides pteronyssinus TaxID=6956 RepID=A0ABQ8JQK5_DERPT|nr:hypothetical protein DERP_013912 [Dermatophagoides pteronyssinus]